MRRLGNVPALDGVRGIAICAVMLLHGAGSYFPGGAIGVDLFFALSAYLITSLILVEATDTDGGYRFREFYWRRFFRLAPALVLWLVVIAAPTSVATGETDRIVGSSFVSLFYFGNYDVVYGWIPLGSAYTHIWSLAIEEQFYLLWPVTLVLLLRHSRARLRAVLTTLLAVATITQVLLLEASSRTYFLPTGHLAAIIVGCLMAEWSFNGLPRRARPVLARAWPAACVLVGVGLYTVAADRLSVDQQAVVITLLCLGGGLLVLHAREAERGSVVRLLSSSALVWVGRRSYGLYLIHRSLAILIPEMRPGISLTIAGPLCIVLSLLLAELSFRFVERPIMRAGRRRRERLLRQVG